MDRTPKLEGSAEQLSVDSNGNAWAIVAHGVRSEIEAFQNNSLVRSYQWPEGTINNGPISPQITSAPQVQAFTVADPQHASNVAIAHGKTLQRSPTKATINWRRLHWARFAPSTGPSKEGISLEGIVTFPADYQAGRTYPFHGAAARRPGSERLASARHVYADLCRHGVCRVAAAISRLDRLRH